MKYCPHYDYGKSADKALGAYCLLKKTCVEFEDCESCEEVKKAADELMQGVRNGIVNYGLSDE